MIKKSNTYILILVVLILSSSTLAYYSTRKTTLNIIQKGDVKISLNDEIGAKTIVLMPDNTQENTLRIKNESSQDVWLRIKAEHIQSTLIDLEIKSTDWVKEGGYYYYRTPLKSEETVSLQIKMSLPRDFDYAYKGSVFDITFIAEATQVINNGDHVDEIRSWKEVHDE